MVSGCAGSGKTTVALLRTSQIINNNKKEKIIFFVFNRLLRDYLKNTASNFQPDIIIGIWSWFNTNFGVREPWKLDKNILKQYVESYINQNGKLDTIIIDEGQDIPEHVYEIFEELKLSNHITVCADDSQIIYPDRSTDLPTIKEKILARSNVLTKNYRNTKEIFNFSKYFLPDDERIAHPDFEPIREDPDSKPVIYKLPSIEKQTQKIIDIINENKFSAGSIGIALNKKIEVNNLFNILKQNKIDASMHHGDAPIETFKSPLVTTYKSFKGLEFDIVILPEFHESNSVFRKIDYNIKKDFYVACTRAKEKLYIIGYDIQPYIFKNIPSELYIYKELK